MLLEVKNWQEECEVRALKFAETMMLSFSDGLEGCAPCLPRVEHEGKSAFRAIDRDVLLNIFVDALMGATANICASYCNDLSSVFEDKVVLEFRRKFFVMRQRSLEAAKELKKIPIAEVPKKEELT